MTWRWIVLSGLIVATAGCASVGGADADPALASPEVERGRRLVAHRCAGCHSVNPDRMGVYRASPPLWLMPERHTPESLQRAIAPPAHDRWSMPSVVLTRGEAADVLAYLRAFAKADARGRRKLNITPCIATAC